MTILRDKELFSLSWCHFIIFYSLRHGMSETIFLNDIIPIAVKLAIEQALLVPKAVRLAN